MLALLISMSLFQIKDYWAHETAVEEECGYGCLIVSNIDNAANKMDKVICGSFNGILHIYSPSSNYNAHDVLLETTLDSPILQLSSGRLVSGSTDLHLGVLHPRLFTVYKVSMSEGAVDHGNQYRLEMMYQHKLERTAANMTYGQFGRVDNKDFVCIQSVDGALSMYEHETFMFTRFLPDSLLPGPLVYNMHSDGFLTVSSNNHLESYSYQVLAVATDSRDKEDSSTSGGGKRINVDWSFNLGENAIDLAVVEQNAGKPCIMVLGERSLFCVETSGNLRFMKKFEFQVACFKVIQKNDSTGIKTIICTHSMQLLIYNNVNLKWAAKLFEVPVCLCLANINSINGMMVFLNEKCHVLCAYLGTSPTIFELPRSKQRESDLQTLDQNAKILNKHILQLEEEGEKLDSKPKEESIKLSFNINKSNLNLQSASTNDADADNIPPLPCQILMKVARQVNDVQVSVECSLPICTTLQHLSFPSLSATEGNQVMETSFFLNKKITPYDLEVSVFVSYKESSSDTPKVSNMIVSLPLTFVARAAPPVKKMEHKLTLETNEPCFNLMDLFHDLVNEESGPTCIGIEYINGVKATILTSKTSNRYRVQCETYAGLWLITNELITKIKKSKADVIISLQDQPILAEYHNIIDKHFHLRQGRNEIRLLLEHRSHQYRAVQRQILTMFKDKAPTSLKCFDTLLEGTHTQIMALADAHKENDAMLLEVSCELSSATLLIILLLKIWKGLSDEEEAILTAAFAVRRSYSIASVPGWQEIVDVAIFSILKTYLSLNNRDSSMSSTMQQYTAVIDIPEDTNKLKKHISILVDRIAKGGRILTTNSEEPLNENGDDTVTQNNSNFDAAIDKEPDQQKTIIFDDVKTSDYTINGVVDSNNATIPNGYDEDIAQTINSDAPSTLSNANDKLNKVIEAN